MLAYLRATDLHAVLLAAAVVVHALQRRAAAQSLLQVEAQRLNLGRERRCLTQELLHLRQPRPAAASASASASASAAAAAAAATAANIVGAAAQAEGRSAKAEARATAAAAAAAAVPQSAACA